MSSKFDITTFIPLFLTYLGLYILEAYFQCVEIPDIFSNNSLTYLIPGFLKPLPVLAIQAYCAYLDEIAKNKSQKVHTADINKLGNVI